MCIKTHKEQISRFCPSYIRMCRKEETDLNFKKTLTRNAPVKVSGLLSNFPTRALPELRQKTAEK